MNFPQALLMLIVMISCSVTCDAQDMALKPRLVVCTDIAPADVEPDDLTFRWWQQPEIGTTTLNISTTSVTRQGDVALINIPGNTASTTCHVICEVHDNGPFHLVSYRRIIIQLSIMK